MPSQLRLPQLNDIRLIGRLTRDPELRFTTGGAAVCRFDVAVNRRYKDKTGEWKDDVSFIPVVVWRDAAQRCGDRLKKGHAVYVEGRLKSRSWETKEGQKRSGLEVESLRVQFLEKLEAAASGDEETFGAAAPEAGAEVPETAGAGVGGEEIPF